MGPAEESNQYVTIRLSSNNDVAFIFRRVVAGLQVVLMALNEGTRVAPTISNNRLPRLGNVGSNERESATSKAGL